MTGFGVFSCCKDACLGYNVEILVKNIVNNFSKLSKSRCIELNRSNIVFSVFFCEIVYIEHIFFFTVEKEYLFVLQENSLINLKLFFLRFK